MAVLNAAYALAGRGRHVLVIDMDLEAPGISEFLEGEKGETEGSPEFDAIDLVSWARDVVRTAGDAIVEPDFVSPNPPTPAAFIRWAPKSQLEKVRPRLGWIGRLDFIAVRQDENYLKRLEDLGLASLSRRELNRTGVIIRRWLRNARLEFTFPGLEEIEGPRQVPYDYILIDSRTGITEIGGLCVGPLSDRLVVLTALNDQNIYGTARFLREIGIDKTRQDCPEPWDAADVPASDPEAPPRLGPKPTLVVTSLLPAGELE
jgi:cellulose biosynthesis protein BcsQ